MKIAIIGCGAMGSVYAGLLAAAGNDVLAIDHSGEHVAAMCDPGLRVEGASGDQTVRVRALTSVPNEAADLVIIATKAAQAAAAARESRPLLHTETVVLTIQNGIGASRQVAQIVGEHRLAVGIAGGFGASRMGAGHVRHTAMKTVRIGAHSTLERDRLETVAGVWRRAGFAVETVNDVAAMQWEKLICNVAFSGPCALTGLTVEAAMKDPNLRDVCLSAAEEAWRVARAQGIDVDVTDPGAYVRAFAETVGAARPSVLQDLEAGRPTEIDVLSGAVVREASEVGLSAPVNATITALVRQRQGDVRR